MDLSILEQLIPNLAGWLHMQPSTLLLYVGVLMTLANFTGRMIPDTATGWRGVLRQVCKFVGIYAQNRVAPGVRMNDVVKDIIGQQAAGIAQETIRDLASESDSLIPEVVGDNVRSIARDSLEAMRRRGEIDPNPDK